MGPIASAALLVVLLAPLGAIASNFGSNTTSRGTPAHVCDETSASQCVANNSTHTVDDIGLSTEWRVAMNDAMVKYDSDPSVSTTWVNGISDVWAYSGTFGFHVAGERED